MYCKKCGSQLKENDQFCQSCGAPVNEVVAQNENLGENNKGQAIVNGNTPNENMQQSWMNGYNNQPYNSGQVNFNQRPNNNTKYIIIGIGIVIAILLVIILVSSMGNKSENNNSSISGGSGGTQTVSNSTYKVNFEGFTFNFPTDLIYQIEDSSLYIADETGSWMTVMMIEYASFDSAKAQKDRLQSYYQENGYTVPKAAQIKTYGGTEYLTLELSYAGENVIFAYAKLDATHVACIVVMDAANSFSYTPLEEMASVIQSANYTGTSNYIQMDSQLNLDSITKFVK